MRTRTPQFLVWLVFFGALPARAAPGDVDPTFVYPRPQAPEPDSTNAVPLADGFLVIKSRDFDKAGADSTLEITRIDEDGRVVPAFGDGGEATTRMRGAVNVATATKALPNGSILLGGFRFEAGAVDDNVAAIARVDSTGHLDPAFGNSGVAVFDVPGQLDRVGAIDVLADGRIVAGVWSRMIRDPYGDCSTDRVNLVLIKADGSGAEVIFSRERNSFSDDGCRTTLTIQVLPDQWIAFGSQTVLHAFNPSDPTASLPPAGVSTCCLGPFVVGPNFGYAVTTLWYDGPGVVFSPDYDRPVDAVPGYWYGLQAGIGRRVLPTVLAGDGGGRGWFLGIANDGGQAAIVKLRAVGSPDTGWGGGDGVVTIEGSGRAGVTASEGLATDIRLINVRPGGETMVVVTADGIVERRFAQSGPAHGALRLMAPSYGDGGGFESLTGTVEVPVRRYGGSDGAVSVDYQVRALATDCQVDACARAGEDFLASSGRLDWSDGDSTDRVITVRILDDRRPEKTETFQVELSAPTGGAVNLPLSFGNVVDVDIMDDDSPAPVGSGGSGNSGGGSGAASGGGGATSWLSPLMLMLAAASRSLTRRPYVAAADRGRWLDPQRTRTVADLSCGRYCGVRGERSATARNAA